MSSGGLLLGKVYGRGVQDLHYGELNPRFRMFDTFIDRPRRGQDLDRDELKDALQFMEEVGGAVPNAPVALGMPPIYDGP